MANSPIEPNSERTQPGGSAVPVSANAPTTAPASLPTDERRTLLLDAADDCLELANYLLNDAPNMGARKEQRYRALADESLVRAKALRAWAEERPAPDVGGGT